MGLHHNPRLVFLTLVSVTLVHLCSSSSSGSFHLKKYNDIWERALGKTMSKEKLVQLRKLLHKFDRIELEEKHKEEQRNDGSQPKSMVDDHLKTVLEEYDLVNRKVADFADVRLNELWRHAVKRGDYSEEELHSLHEEMQHMDTKMNRVHSTLRSGKDDLQNSVEENLIDSKMKVDKTSKVDQELLHKEFKELKNNILKKNKLTHGLKDQRVMSLWDSAQGGSFSEDELTTIREELLHFQRYIDKLEHWEGLHNQLKVKGGASERVHAEDRLTEYKRKVKKFHKTMVAKIEEKTEL